jgi:tRNA modification GTPase
VRAGAATASYAKFRDAAGEVIDFGLALYFPAPPRSPASTLLELHGHGSPVLQEQLIERAVQLGARRARPGEFSERAFLEDKLDLAQAELSPTSSPRAHAPPRRRHCDRCRASSRAGSMTAEEALIDLRVYVEASIDFPEEEIDFLASAEVAQRLALVNRTLESVTQAARQGSLLRGGPHVRDRGRPNAGKSTLMNRLAGYDAAIVTDQPGTTRDVLRESVELDGLPVTLIDTAGLRVDSPRSRRARGHAARPRRDAPRGSRPVRHRRCRGSARRELRAGADEAAGGRAGDVAVQQGRRARLRGPRLPPIPHLYLSGRDGEGVRCAAPSPHGRGRI